MARNGRKTRIVRIAVKFKFSMFKQYSRAPDSTMKKSKRFHESARYVFFPYTPIAIILMVISKEKNANMISSNIYKQIKWESKKKRERDSIEKKNEDLYFVDFFAFITMDYLCIYL